MTRRIGLLGLVLAAIGLAFLAAGGFAFAKTQAGYASLQKFSEAQGVELTYNDTGELTDRGETEEAQAILSLLRDDWGFPVVVSDLDPDDPLVNTATEYMYQMAAIGYHTLNSTQTVVLDEDVEYNDETFEAGSYDVAVDGRYWTDFDREHPIDGKVREQAWTGTVHGLFGELGVGTVTHSALQLALGIAGLLAGLGATLLLAGLGLVWASRSQQKASTAPMEASATRRELAQV